VSAPPSRHSAVAPACDEHHCITCGDDGVPMRVVAIDDRRGLALCERAEDGARESVEIALVMPVAPDDLLLVHAGTALTRLSSAETGDTAATGAATA
jgi:hydrogenase maturation factor